MNYDWEINTPFCLFGERAFPLGKVSELWLPFATLFKLVIELDGNTLKQLPPDISSKARYNNK